MVLRLEKVEVPDGQSEGEDGEEREGRSTYDEVVVVGLADAVVEPLAVMVELVAAPVAGAAVLRVCLDH